ncbi:MAG: HAD family hydrolase [Planctomycetota bacterium]
MLILFDIDGTLLLTHRAGACSMLDAAREMFGEAFTFDGVEIAGRMDPLIWADAARVNGIADPHAHHDRFRAVYARHLARRLHHNHKVTVLPGVRPLVAALDAIDHVQLGLLTGNYPETGRLKIEAAGLDPDMFAVAAWGSDAPTRRDLPGVARARHARRTGTPVGPDDTIIIGDTPHDVDCARAHGCRCLAVATGPYSRRELEACGADLLVDDLSQTDEILSWILQPTPAPDG